MRKAAICTVGLIVCMLAGSAYATAPNQIRITVPSHALASTTKDGQTFTVTAHGFARRAANAYLFTDFAGCAKSFSTERHRALKHAFYRWAVLGSFRHASWWGSNGAGLDHACAYLVAKGTGTVLARSSVSFRVYPQH